MAACVLVFVSKTTFVEMSTAFLQGGRFALMGVYFSFWYKICYQNFVNETNTYVMLRTLRSTLLISTLFLYWNDASSQSAIQKKDHLITGRFGAYYQEAPFNRSLNLNITLNWQYMVSSQWALGLGMGLGKVSSFKHALQYGQNDFEENFSFSPSILAARFYHINEKWTFALGQELTYFKNLQRVNINYALIPAIYYKFKPHWLISAQTSIASINYTNYDYFETPSFVIFISPTLDAFMPNFAISYLL
jgi:hypothetical protein